MLDNELKALVEMTDESLLSNAESGYPSIQYGWGNIQLAENGVKNYDAQGGWFITKDAIPAPEMEEALVKAGWVAQVSKKNPDNPLTGLYKPNIEVVWITDRLCGEFRDKRRPNKKGGLDITRVPFSKRKDYEKYAENGRITGRSHTLVFLSGLESLGPFVLTTHGVVMWALGVGSKPYDGTIKRQIIDVYGKVIKERWSLAGAPTFLFKTTIGIPLDAQGNVIFEKRGTGSNTQQMVIPRAYNMPVSAEKVTEEMLKAVMVNTEIYKQAMKIAEDAKEWREAWENLTGNEASASDASKDAPEPDPEELAM